MQDISNEKLLEEAMEVFQSLPALDQREYLGYGKCMANAVQAKEAQKLPSRPCKKQKTSPQAS